MQVQKIIYSKWLMTALVERGFVPITAIPHPYKLNYNCWIFPYSEELNQAITDALVQRGGNNND